MNLIVHWYDIYESLARKIIFPLKINPYLKKSCYYLPTKTSCITAIILNNYKNITKTYVTLYKKNLQQNNPFISSN